MSERHDREIGDRVIDEAARQMTDAQPPADFRARVLARIAEGRGARRRWRAAWILPPIAATAAIVVAILVARGPREPAPVAARLPSAPVAEMQAPQEPSRIEPAYAPQSGFGVTGKRPPRAITERAINTSDVEALAPPPLVAPSLAIATLTIDSIALEELETPARIAIASLATPEGEGP